LHVSENQRANDRATLDDSQIRVVAAARDKAHTLYAGVAVAHHSCGIALAETFGLPSRPYQSLRRGGISGCGTCGAVRAGETILGEVLGDPDPTGAVTPALGEAMLWYQRQVAVRLDRGESADLICNNLTAPLGNFHGDRRHQFCTSLVADVAALVAEALIRFDPSAAELVITPVAVAGESS